MSLVLPIGVYETLRITCPSAAVNCCDCILDRLQILVSEDVDDAFEGNSLSWRCCCSWLFVQNEITDAFPWSERIAFELSVVSIMKAASQSSISTSSSTAHCNWRVIIVDEGSMSCCTSGRTGENDDAEGMLTPTVSMSPESGIDWIARRAPSGLAVCGGDTVAVVIGATEKNVGAYMSPDVFGVVAVPEEVVDDDADCASTSFSVGLGGLIKL